eukprot:13040-Heterococcus_DN1.PRE.4
MVFRGAWAAYNNALTAQPLLVKAATSFTGFTVGDILAQKVRAPRKWPRACCSSQCFRTAGAYRRGLCTLLNTSSCTALNYRYDKYDFMRTLRLGSFGALVHGPTGHFFYGMLDRKLPGTSPTTVATKVAIDQGKSAAQIVDKIQADLQTAVMGSWAVWIPAHTINFRFVPSSQRLLYINSIQIGYNVSTDNTAVIASVISDSYAVFLSFLGNKGTPAVEDKAHDAHVSAHDAKEYIKDSASQAKDDLREAKGVIKSQAQQARDACCHGVVVAHLDIDV